MLRSTRQNNIIRPPLARLHDNRESRLTFTTLSKEKNRVISMSEVNRDKSNSPKPLLYSQYRGSYANK